MFGLEVRRYEVIETVDAGRPEKHRAYARECRRAKL